MGFEVTKKNVKDVSSFLSQSELKKDRERERKAKVKETSLQVSGDYLGKRTDFRLDAVKQGLFRQVLHVFT